MKKDMKKPSFMEALSKRMGGSLMERGKKLGKKAKGSHSRMKEMLKKKMKKSSY